MTDFNQKISVFFDDYARRFQSAIDGVQPDVEGTAGSFANVFLEASPVGIRCASNDAAFREAIPKGYDFYKKIGTNKMEIGHKEITPLDNLHALVKIHWLSSYLKKDHSKVAIEFDVFYIVQVQDVLVKIFCYITGDEQKALAAYGLLES